MAAQRWRKKPVEIEAVQYDGGNAEEICQWVDDNSGDFCPAITYGSELIISTLEGDMRASVGDWIIRGVQGEFYPCKPDIFAATYDSADAPEAQPFSWQVTRTEDSNVQIVVGDQWPANDGTDGPKLTEESFTAVTFHTIGKTLRQLGDRLIDQASAVAHGDDEGWDD